MSGIVLDHLVEFQLFFRDIGNLDILSNGDLAFVKAKTKEAALSSYRSYDNNVKKDSLLCKTCLKRRIGPFRNLIRVTLLLLWRGKII